jgi:exopolysaccharide biosynthesis polyprenyl glycosylphosphotransferase
MVMVGGFGLSGAIYHGAWVQRPMLEAQLLLPLYLTLALYNGTYSLGSLDRMRVTVVRVVSALFLSAALLNFITFYTKTSSQLSRVIFTLGLMLSLFGMLLIRRVMARWLRRQIGPGLLNVLLIEAGGPKVTIRDAYHIDAVEHGMSPSLDDPGGLDRLGRAIRNMDRVVVSCPPEQREAWAFILRGAAIHGEVISEEAEYLHALGVHHYRQEGFTTLVIATGPLSLRSRIVKRLFDVTVSSAALVAFSPILLGAALAIKLEDGGPVLFRQRRMGKANRFFTIYKFRSMAVASEDADGTRSASPDDARVTRVGRVLRRLSIDELPQFWNVFISDMSIVGPRPHALGSKAGEKYFWEVDGRYWQRHALKPGLTGLAQVRGLRGATDLEEDLSSRLQADLEYLAGWNILRDVIILLTTLRVLVHDKAY